MKCFFLRTVTLATVVTLPPLIALAQNSDPQNRAAQNPAAQTQRTAKNAGNLDPKTSGANVRVSQLMGLNIQNAQGQSVGEINDLVIDSHSGKVRYAAVTYGGLFGLGDKLFAVPFEAFQVGPDPDDADDFVMLLEVTKEQLEGAQGFDQDHWPNMADRKMLRDLDKRYGVDRAKLRNREAQGDLDVDRNRRGVDVEVDPK